MYIRDETADEIVNKQTAIQDHVQGRSVLLWLPGMGAGVATQTLLMLGGIGSAVAVFWLWSPEVDDFKFFIGGMAVVALPMALIFNAVVRGAPRARTHMHRLSLVQTAVAAAITLICVLRWNTFSLALATVGLVFSALAARLIAGPAYATLAAIYRAQRVHLEKLQQATR